MICLDSWIWLEFVFEDDRLQDAKAVIETANSPTEGGIVPATVVAEVSYRVRRQKDQQIAAETVDAIRSFEHFDILPVTDELAEYAAALRDKYDQRGDCELSYADGIHLAMAAAVSDCDTLYTGDPEFEGVDEIETVVL